MVTMVDVAVLAEFKIKQSIMAAVVLVVAVTVRDSIECDSTDCGSTKQ